MAAMKLTRAANRERVVEVLKRLREGYPDARCSLDHENPLQLLVATILAAQCTDERVNMVTKSLFSVYRTALDYAECSQEDLEGAIRTCGFFRQKAKHIRKTCGSIADRFAGEVPGSMDDLLELDGVGRKTANVILGECFAPEGVVVDTHCRRLAQRLGFTRHDDPAKIERDLMAILPREDWRIFSHCLVFHGRAVCNARKPDCGRCALNEVCPYPHRAGPRKKRA
jgi:endonuclease III